MQTSLSRRLLIASASSLLVLGLAACTSDTTDDATTPTSTQSAPATQATGDASALCADLETVRGSLDALVSTEVLREGTATLKERFATFESSVRDFIDAAQAEFAPQATAARAAVDDLKAAVDGLADSPSVSDVAAITAALASVRASVTALIDAVQGAC
jgi:hypothetical protein